MSAAEIAEGLKLRRSGRQWRGPCPLHGGTKAAFALADGADGGVVVHCHAGCAGREILVELRRRGLLPQLGEAGAARPGDRSDRDRVATKPPAQPLDWSSRAEHLWCQGEPIAGTPVETYLRARCCALPRSDEIRFLPPGPFGPHPCMMARVTDALTAAPISLHFTRLRGDGSGKAEVEKAKLLLTGHRKAGGCIRLCADEQVQAGLGLAEGIETALRVMADGWHPVWAAIDAGNMATWPVLLGVESLTLFADHDKAGLRSADTCRTRWRDAGRECRIVSPREIGADWADVVTS